MKKILLIAAALFLISSPVNAATKQPTTAQLKSQIVTLNSMVEVLKEKLTKAENLNKQYEGYFQPMVDLVSSTKANNLELKIFAQQSLDTAQKAVNLMNQYKSMCSSAATSYSSPAPVVASTPIPTVAPIIKCFYGYTVECFDYNQFSPELIAQLNAITQKPVSMQSIVGEQLRAIHNAGF